MEEVILKRYAECGNGGIIAKELGITNYKVYQCLRKNGIRPKKVGGKEVVSLETLSRDYCNGDSLTDISHRYGIRPESVWERLKNHGVTLRSQSEAHELRGHTKIKVSDESDVLKMYASGLSAQDIAQKYECYKDAVLRVLHKHHMNIRNNFGSNNKSWKGGRVPLNKAIRNHSKYISWRSEVMKERDYTCEVTGQRGGKLEVHHKNRFFSDLVDDFMIHHGSEVMDDREVLNAAIEAFQPFWDKTNIILVTKEVHKTFHILRKDRD